MATELALGRLPSLDTSGEAVGMGDGRSKPSDGMESALPDGDTWTGPGSTEDPVAGDRIPSPDRHGADFDFSGEEEEDGEGGSEWGSEFSMDSNDRRLKRNARWERATPGGARRSKRFKPGEDGAEEEGEDANGGAGVERGQGESAAAAAAAASPAGQQHGAAKEEQQHEEEEAVVWSPSSSQILRRTLSQEAVEADVKDVHAMWEMAAILDFMHLFRKEVRLHRSFGAAELERVLVTSPGDGGLLADIHIDIMRGISPKNEITTANWQVHLANKIKFHWRALLDHTPSPFKPEKYLEAVSYAALPSRSRVRALHFLCCIRCDRDDIQARINECERPKSRKEVADYEAALEAARQRAARGTRSARTAQEEVAVVAMESPDSFRREPTGIDASGVAYYFFDMTETTGFRLYRDLPWARPGSSTATAAELAAAEEAAVRAAEERAAAEAAAMAAAEAAAKKRGKGRGVPRRAQPPQPLYKVRDPPLPGRWELAASTIEELQTVGQRLARSMKPEDKALGLLFTEELAPALQEKADAEERRRRAAERVRSRLGVAVELDGLAAGGRSRRERRQVNYSFTEYDDQLRSAIRRSQRAESPADDRWRRRAASPLQLNDLEAAQVGMRRGRSAAAVNPHLGSAMELNERALRLAARDRSVDGYFDEQQEGGQGGEEGVLYGSDSDGAMADLEEGTLGEGILEYEDDEEDSDYEEPGRGRKRGAASGRRAAEAAAPTRAARPARTSARAAAVLAQEQAMDDEMLEEMAAHAQQQVQNGPAAVAAAPAEWPPHQQAAPGAAVHQQYQHQQYQQQPYPPAQGWPGQPLQQPMYPQQQAMYHQQQMQQQAGALPPGAAIAAWGASAPRTLHTVPRATLPAGPPALLNGTVGGWPPAPQHQG